MHGAILHFLCPHSSHPIHLHVLAAGSQKPNLFTSLHIHMDHLSPVDYYILWEVQPSRAKWSLCPFLPFYPQLSCAVGVISLKYKPPGVTENRTQMLYHGLHTFYHLASSSSLFSYLSLFPSLFIL